VVCDFEHLFWLGEVGLMFYDLGLVRECLNYLGSVLFPRLRLVCYLGLRFLLNRT
jgi:hypothetical protein